MSMTQDTLTQWTNVEPYATDLPNWLPEEDRLRVAAYQAYEEMYWNVEEVFSLIRRDEDGPSLIIPKPMSVVDTTAYYLMKGLKIQFENAAANRWLTDFFDREAFYSRWDAAKHSGVQKGDWLFHITGDPNKEEGKRLALTTLDPAVYFPEYHPDDMETVVGVRLITQWPDEEDETKMNVRILRYWHPSKLDEDEQDKRVYREETLWEIEDWQDPKSRKLVKVLIPESPLPSEITTIPVYHFKNKTADGYPFGNSELRGFERLFQGINQAASDEELALALSGLGVFATDAGRPINSIGEETDWVASPGAVWEMPGATMVKRLEGITTVTPVQDHLAYLAETLNEATQTSDVALGNIDANTAESGIALAIKFIPTIAKMESRDQHGLAVMRQMMFDLMLWVKVYENKDFTSLKLDITLGDKLPVNRAKILEELNNMFDRKIISAQYYRDQATEQLGYEFPPNIEAEMLEEQKKLAEVAMVGLPQQQIGPGGRKEGAGDTLPDQDQNNANNDKRTNESDGTEIDAD